MLDGNARSVVLKVSGLEAFYGQSHVLHGIDFEICRGELVTLIGRNGAGKTTTLRSVMGLVSHRGGIDHLGDDISDAKPNVIARRGIGYVPEERGIFSKLSVLENLLLPPIINQGGFSLDEVYELFPNLKERVSSPGTKLSGGEQQMLAMGRVLRTGADMLLLDEVTEGLAPNIVAQISMAINRMKSRGLTMLLVEQDFHFAATVADRHYVVEHGKIMDMFTNEDVHKPATAAKLRAYLGV